MENEFGPGKSWNLLCNNADAGAKICVPAQCTPVFCV